MAYILRESGIPWIRGLGVPPIISQGSMLALIPEMVMRNPEAGG